MVMILKILVGLVGMGLVILVHETGHFLAARLVGIEVEAFSIGWGKAIFKKTIRGVEYRLGIFPLGGYCKMRGENEIREAYENKLKKIPRVKGTYYGASPWRRILVSFAGPFFNVLFAVIVFSCVWGAGFTEETLENRIVLASDIDGGAYPADAAALATGDRIIEVRGEPTPYSRSVQALIASNPEIPLDLTVERGAEILHLSITPRLDKPTGSGKIGVYFWTDPLIAAVQTGSPAQIAGLEKGDKILRVNALPIPHTAALYPLIREEKALLDLEVERRGEVLSLGLVPNYAGGDPLGLSFRLETYASPPLSLPAALAKGVRESWETLVLSIRSLGYLFKGIDLTQAVSGPIRITYMLGDVAAAGFGRSVGAGFSSLSSFLALISLALCVMNLLPLPVLDGGMIVLFLVEALARRPLSTRVLGAFQALGVVLILGLMIFAVFGDILFLAHQ